MGLQLSLGLWEDPSNLEHLKEWSSWAVSCLLSNAKVRDMLGPSGGDPLCCRASPGGCHPAFLWSPRTIRWARRTLPLGLEAECILPALPSSSSLPDLRLQLLDVKNNPYLIKALYGLLMLLPQSSAFQLLSHRLQCVPNPELMQTA